MRFAWPSWSSSTASLHALSFSCSVVTRSDLPNTHHAAHLRPQEDAQELADPIRLAKLIKQYSQFIQFPIKLYSSRKEAKQVVDEAATAKRQEEADKIAKDKQEEPIKVSSSAMNWLTAWMTCQFRISVMSLLRGGRQDCKDKEKSQSR
jgi:HSP90 family molecular chaperone